jgi:hypothetical protein
VTVLNHVRKAAALEPSRIKNTVSGNAIPSYGPVFHNSRRQEAIPNTPTAHNSLLEVATPSDLL